MAPTMATSATARMMFLLVSILVIEQYAVNEIEVAYERKFLGKHQNAKHNKQEAERAVDEGKCIAKLFYPRSGLRGKEAHYKKRHAKAKRIGKQEKECRHRRRGSEPHDAAQDRPRAGRPSNGKGDAEYKRGCIARLELVLDRHLVVTLKKRELDEPQEVEPEEDYHRTRGAREPQLHLRPHIGERGLKEDAQKRKHYGEPQHEENAVYKYVAAAARRVLRGRACEVG